MDSKQHTQPDAWIDNQAWVTFEHYEELLAERDGLQEQLEAKQRELDEEVERAVENGRLAKRLHEQFEAERRGKQVLIIKNDRLNAACEAADRLLDDVYAKGEKHAADLLRVRTDVSAALAASSPASEPEAR